MERNLLSFAEFEVAVGKALCTEAEQNEKKSRTIDTEFRTALTEMQKIHAETRALVCQAISEISGLPQELQPAL